MGKMLKLKRAAAVTMLASLLLLTVGSVAFAGTVAGGAEANSACLLDERTLKNEPGLCSRQSGAGTVANSTRAPVPSGSSSDMILWGAVAATIGIAAIAGGTAVTHRRRLRPAA